MLLPYRCKNPPESYPYVTVGIIVANFLVYAFTTHNLLVIKQGVVADFAVSPETMNLFRILSAMFLHENPLHILGNMLFLWLFGSSVEGRLRSGKFAALYFGSGICAQMTQLFSQMAIHDTHTFGLGASGAIMGIAGAYIYMFPHAIIVVFRFWFFMFRLIVGPADWKAWWVIGYFMAINVVNAIITQSLGFSDGTAYMCHVGGFGSGLLIAMLMRPKRDTEIYSQVQATRADVKGDLSQMTLYDLETLLETPTDNMEIVTTYCWKLLMDGGPSGEHKCIKTLNKYKLRLLDTGDPVKIASIALKLPAGTDTLPAVFYLQLGGKLEGVGAQDDAGLCYRRAFDMDKTSRDAEIALIRLGRLLEYHYKNPEQAREAYTVLLTLFPFGPSSEAAQKALERLPVAEESEAVGPAQT